MSDSASSRRPDAELQRLAAAWADAATKWVEATNAYGAAAADLTITLRNLADGIESRPDQVSERLAAAAPKFREVADLVEAETEQQRNGLLSGHAILEQLRDIGLG